MASKYTIFYEPEEEGSYSGRCLELPAAISQGETLEELKKEHDRGSGIGLGALSRNLQRQTVHADHYQCRLETNGWRDVVRVLNKYGFVVVRQSGDHIMMSNPKGKMAVAPRKSNIKVGTQ